MANERELKIRYVGDAAGLKRTLGQIDQMHQGLASKLKTLGAGMANVGKSLTRSVTLPIVAFGAVAANEFTEFQQVQGQTAAALKSTGGAANVTAKEIADLATKVGQLSAVDSETVQAAENVLLTFTQIRNEVGKGNDVFDRATKAVANLSARMGTDMQSAALQVGKALNDPVKGITALTRVGVAFTDQQKKQIAAMVEAGDVAGAQKVILAELQTEFGGSAKAAGAAASPFTKISLTFKDLAQSAGQFVVPILQKLAGVVSTVAKAFEGLSPGAKKMIVEILAVAAAIGPLLIVVGKLVSTIGTVSKAFSALAANPAILIWVVIAAAVIALTIVIVKNWSKIKAFLLKVWNALKAAFSAVWNAIKAVAIGVFDALKAPVVAYFDFYRAIFGKVKDVVVGIWQAIRDTLRGIWEGMKSTAINIWGGLVAGIKAAMNVAIDAINFLIRSANRVSGALDFALGPTFNWADIPQIPSLALGGDIRRAGLAVVGDRGPELVRLSRGAQVIPLGARAGRPERLQVVVRLERRRFGRAAELEVVTSGR